MGFKQRLCHHGLVISLDYRITLMSRLLATALCSALLVGCSTPAPQPQEPLDTAPPVVEAEPEVPERAIPDDSVFPLLLAEFALRRRDYDVTLQQYLEQAPILRDSGISAHTTRLAQYLQNEPAALESALLWAELEPDNADANNIAAGMLARAGRTPEALPYLVQVERLSGDANFPVLANNFTGLSSAERTDMADTIERLGKEFPDSINLSLTQALLFTELGKRGKALEKLDAVFAQEPRQQQALLLEAKILADQGANNPYARVEQALQEDPENSLLRMRYARMLTRSDMSAARTQFEVLSAQSPDDADLLFSLALINREVGDPLAASAYLRQVIASGERVSESYYYLGRIAEESDRPEDAIEFYSKVEGGAEQIAAVSRVGELLAQRGEFERSQLWFAEQRRKTPERREQLYGIESDIVSRFGSPEQAIRLLDEAIAASPDASPSLRYNRAMLFEQQDDLVAMEEQLRGILDRDPANATALNALGYTLANRTNRFEEGLELIQRALELQPGEPAILDSMGWALFRMGRYKEALDYLTRAYAEFPDPEVAAHLGEVLWVTGDKESALKIWRSGALRDPQHKVLRSTLDRLGIDLESTSPGDHQSADPLR
ncbi:MAG: tetratricopeptide (TPR) repeat protein [Bacteroidia bacterium]